MSWVDRLTFRPAVRDERGRRHVVTFTDESPRHDALVRREYQRLLLHEHRRLLLAWVATTGVLLASMVWLRPLLGSLFGYLMIAAMLALALPLSVHFQRVNSGAWRASRLAMGLCAACAYNLRGVPAQHDGLTICPECAAAWKVDRIEPLPLSRNL